MRIFWDHRWRKTKAELLPIEIGKKICKKWKCSRFNAHGIYYDEIHIFAYNSCSQNKNQFLFSLCSAMACQNIFGYSKVRLSFMCVEHTKFAPDSSFGYLKKKLQNRELLKWKNLLLTTAIEKEQEYRVYLTALMYLNLLIAHSITVFYVYQWILMSFIADFSLQYFHIKFSNNGTFQGEPLPCGEEGEWKLV